MKVAFIREESCVGCTKCLLPCPVDAIIGAPQWMHTVLSDECIGCGLCIAPCPMDCIEMIESPVLDGSLEKRNLAEKAKLRYTAKKTRLIRNALPQLPSQDREDPNFKAKIKSEIAAAFVRGEKKRVTHECN